MAYVDVGLLSGSATVFLLGNLVCSYLWRNIIPHFSGKSRLVAADLIGFGHSDKVTELVYRRLPRCGPADREAHAPPP